MTSAQILSRVKAWRRRYAEGLSERLYAFHFAEDAEVLAYIEKMLEEYEKVKTKLARYAPLLEAAEKIDSIKGWAIFQQRGKLNDLHWWSIAQTRREAIKKIVDNYREPWPLLKRGGFYAGIIWITPAAKKESR